MEPNPTFIPDGLNLWERGISVYDFAGTDEELSSRSSTSCFFHVDNEKKNEFFFIDRMSWVLLLWTLNRFIFTVRCWKTKKQVSISSFDIQELQW
jgi:hypothetical protein